MPRRFSIRPTLTLRGRAFKGLRGFSGKPFHPPLTDFPVAAYVLAMVFDVVSIVAGDDSSVGRDFFVSATHVVIAGAAVSLLTALTGFWDWLRSTEPGTQARRTANWHMAVMLTVTLIVLADIAVRLAQWDDGATSAAVLVLSIAVGLLVGFGAAFGGALVFEYGFNVETGGDSPVWHKSERDVLPGEQQPAPSP
ncbi:MAG: DUF2231 domain-containing protein [Acidimicrobiia bacterium]